MTRILLYLSVFSPLIPVATGIKKRSLLWYYAVIGFLIDFTTTFAFSNSKINIIGFLNFFLLLEFLIISSYYQRLIVKNKFVSVAVILTPATIFIITTINAGLYKFNALGGAFLQLIYIIYAIAGFYTMLKSRAVLFLERSDFFWINIGVLIHFSGEFLMFLFFQYLSKADSSLLAHLWQLLHMSLNIFFSISLGIAFYVQGLLKHAPGNTDH